MVSLIIHAFLLKHLYSLDKKLCQTTEENPRIMSEKLYGNKNEGDHAAKRSEKKPHPEIKK